MSILIEGFKKEHSGIIKEFRKVEQLGRSYERRDMPNS